MKQKIRKIGLMLIIAIIVILQANKALATTSTSDYTIQSYNISMIVNEDNTFDITETINAYFNVAKHGIYRKIPLKNTVTRIDGTTSKNKAKITDISVNANYSVTNENGYKVIKIGDANSTLTGSQTYTIKYKYDIGNDPLKNVDELYYNLIGDQWDTDIQYTSFSITMPKAFDKSTLGFSSGYKGSTNSKFVNYEVRDNTIIGVVNKTLSSGEGLTVRLTLPEGYFTKKPISIDIYTMFTILLCAVFILIADILWKKYGKDNPVIDTVEFYPPEGMNSAEVGYIYKGQAENNAVISLLIYLANKGYLEISETEEKGLLKKSKGFKITKIKEYDGNNKFEKMFFDGLFKCTSYRSLDFKKLKEIAEKADKKITINDAIGMINEDEESKISVTKSDLYDNFYVTLNKIKSEMNAKEYKNTIFEKASNSKIKWLVLMELIIFVLITAKPVLEYSGAEMLVMALLFPGIGFAVLLGSIIGTSKIPKIFGIMWGLLFGGMPWSFMVLPALLENPIYLVAYIIGVVSIIVLMLFQKIMPKRTVLGNELYGKVKGFKRFLETAEKDQLEALVERNPQYFYNILPYTYALGVSKKWMEQFEAIALQAPDWYVGYETFSTHEFNSFMRDTMYSAQSAMSSSPSSDGSSSGGSFSGGGSSGGGSGGGGGGSW